MGSKYSCGSVRAELHPIVPGSWTELEHLYLRFQQESYRRRAAGDLQSQYFINAPMFLAITAPFWNPATTDKADMLRAFTILNRREKNKLPVIDFFSGLAMVVDAKKAIKFEFLLSLLDNGGLKTLNRCELLMLLTATARGLSMFKGLSEVGEEMLKLLAKRLLGDQKEILKQAIVNKALADAEIVFFMNDLDSEIATTPDGLLAKQATLIRSMVNIDRQEAQIAIKDFSSRSYGEHFSSTAVPVSPSSPRRVTNTTSVEVLVRKLHNLVIPSNHRVSDFLESMAEDKEPANRNVLESKKRFDVRSIQRLIKRVSDGSLIITSSEAHKLLIEMEVDDLGMVKCGDILRVVGNWIHATKTEYTSHWENVADTVLGYIKRAQLVLRQFWTMLQPREMKHLKAAEVPSEERATGIDTDARNVQDSRTEDMDGEIHFNANIRIGSKHDDPGASFKQNALKFRFGVHPSSSVISARNRQQADYADQAENSSHDAMRIYVEFALKRGLSEEDGIDLASSLEKCLLHPQVWRHLSWLWSMCHVTIAGSSRTESVGQSSPKCLQIEFVCNSDVFAAIESQTNIQVSNLVKNIFVVGEMDQSIKELVVTALDSGDRLSMLSKKENREVLQRTIFEFFDAGKTGKWSLEEFNAFQQALKKTTLDDIEFAKLFPGSASLSFQQFVSCYEHCTAIDFATLVRQLEIGSLSHLLTGSITVMSVLHEPCLKGLHSLLNPLRWGAVLAKQLLFLCRSTNDFSYDLHFANLAAFLNFVGAPRLSFLRDPTFISTCVQTMTEYFASGHPKHEKDDDSCRSIFCSVANEVAKTPQQLEFDDQNLNRPPGTGESQVVMLRNFLNGGILLKEYLQGLEFVEVRSSKLQVLLEFENFSVDNNDTKPSAEDHDVTKDI